MIGLEVLSGLAGLSALGPTQGCLISTRLFANRCVYTYICLCILYIYITCIYIWLKSTCCLAPVSEDVFSTQTQDQAASSRYDSNPLLLGQGRHGNVVRSTCWYVRNGCSCGYTYGNARVGLTRSICSQFKKTMEDLTALVFSSLAPGLSRGLRCLGCWWSTPQIHSQW